MAGDPMNWLREHMREQVAKAPSGDHAKNVVHFPADTAPPRNDPSTALDLVSQAASVIRGIEERAAESEARARTLAESALEKLEQAEIRISDAETARIHAEDTLVRLSARLQEAERELARTQARLVAAENRLADAEYQLRAAEARATQADNAVNQIEDAIRAQIVGLQRNLTARARNAA
jgi:chromosome segregation ATPase